MTTSDNPARQPRGRRNNYSEASSEPPPLGLPVLGNCIQKNEAELMAEGRAWQLCGTLAAHKGPVHVARFNTTGKYVLTAGADRQIHLFNASTVIQEKDLLSVRQPVKTYAAHNGSVLSLSVASDNASFISAGEDRSVLQWDVATGSIVRRFSSHTGTVHAVSYCGSTTSPNDVVLAAGYDGVVRFYDVRARGAWRPLMECKDAKDAILCVACHETCVFTGSVDGVVRTYDLRAGELREDTVDRPITSIMPSPQGTTLLISTLGSSDRNDERASHLIMDLEDGSHLQTIVGGLNSKYRCRSTFALNGAAILAGDEEGNIAGWDIVTGERNHEKAWQDAHRKAVLWTEGTTDDKAILTASADGSVKLWSRDGH